MLRRLPRVFRPLLNGFDGFRTVPAMGYKSQYSLDKLYPNSNPDFIRNPLTTESKVAKTDEEFNGEIPVDSLDIRYSRSSGPGGQHVNKVNTKVDIRFHVASAEWLSQRARDALLQQEKTRITKDGYLVVTSDKTRVQLMNQADCLYKIRTLIRRADQKPYEPSAEELAVLKQRNEAARKGILREKRNHSLKKQSRQAPQL